MATHSSILAWRSPWTEEPGGLQSMGSQRVGHDYLRMQAHTWLINNAVLVSSVQQSGSVVHTQVSVLSQIPFPFKLLQSTE